MRPTHPPSTSTSTSTSTTSTSNPSTLTTRLLILLVSLLLLLQPANASIGDRSPEYQSCTTSCFQDSCSINHHEFPSSSSSLPTVDDGTISPFNPKKLPLSLRITGWNCEDDCRYHCTHRITNDAYDRVKRLKLEIINRLDKDDKDDLSEYQRTQKINELLSIELSKLRRVEKEMVQYHGKWVFIRILGSQEPFSVLFSLLNLHVNLIYFFKMSNRISDSFPLKSIYRFHSLIAINSWIWSSIFHTRDKDWTEKLDYFSAGATVLSSFFFTFNRVFMLDPKSREFKWFRISCLIAILLHVVYLSRGRFDYGYNMKANITVGITQSLLWLVCSFKSKTFYNLFGSTHVDRRIVENHKKDQVDQDHHHSSTTRSSAISASLPNPFDSSSTSTSNNHTPTPELDPSTAQTIRNSTSSPLPSNLRNSLQFLLLLTILSTSFELFDFPPFLRLIDAHSLWHLSTVPLTWKWYEFLISDSQNLIRNGLWIDEDLGKQRKESENKRKEFRNRVREELKRRWRMLLQSRKVKQVGKIVRYNLGLGREFLENRGWNLNWLDQVGDRLGTLLKVRFQFDDGRRRNEEEIPLNQEGLVASDDEVKIPIK